MILIINDFILYLITVSKNTLLECLLTPSITRVDLHEGIFIITFNMNVIIFKRPPPTKEVDRADFLRNELVKML